MTDRYENFPSTDELLGMMDSDVIAARDYAKSVKTYAISMQSGGKLLLAAHDAVSLLPFPYGDTFSLVTQSKRYEIELGVGETEGFVPIAEAAEISADEILRLRREYPGLAGYPPIGFLDQPFRNVDGDGKNDSGSQIQISWDGKIVDNGISIAEHIRHQRSIGSTGTPSDEAIQTSRDIVAGKLVDTFTGQIVYADAIIRGVAAAEKKREREIAEAAAWQREHNRDRTGGGSSSSSSGSSSNSNNGRVHIPPGTPNHVRVAGVSYGGQDADARREGGAHGTPTYDNQADRLGHPIVIDLDGDGVEISPLGGSTARFDYDNDGFKELTAWVGKDDGLLVYDVGNDGLITQTREVVIAEWTADTTDMDLEALKAVYFNAGRRGRGANWNSRPRLRAAA